MIDIHSHILHGVDDGCSDFYESLEMLRRAKQVGYSKLILTPHRIEGAYEDNFSALNQRLTELQAVSEKEDMGLELFLGRELYLESKLESDLSSGLIETLAGTPYVLVELPMIGMPIQTKSILHKLMASGYRVVIAHPERNSRLGSDFDLIRELKESGVLFQLNIGSLAGKYGSQVKSAAKELLKEGLIHFVSSDAHRVLDYDYHVITGLETLRNCVSPEDYKLLTKQNQEALLSGCPVEVIRACMPKEISSGRNFKKKNLSSKIKRLLF